MSSKTTVKTEVPPPTEQELELQQKLIDQIELQNQTFAQQSAAATASQNRILALLSPQLKIAAEQAKQQAELFPLQKRLTQLSVQRAEELLPIEKELLELQLEAIKRNGAPTPEQEELINTAYDFALEKGKGEITQFSEDALRQVREQLAPSRGLRPTDSPIIDRGQLVAREGVRQFNQFEQGIESARASTKLNFPLGVSQAVSAQAGFQQNLAQSGRHFQQSLLAEMQRGQSSLTANTLGLSRVPFPGTNQGLALGLLGQLQQNRFAGAPTTTSQSLLPSLIQGGATAVGSYLMSSKSSKNYKQPIDGKAILKKIEKLPVEKWRYKPETGLSTEPHIGPYAEDVKDSFGVGDGKTINIIDIIGLNLAATKQVSKSVNRIEKQVRELKKSA